ncbi:AMP-binding protein [Myxococcus sp. K15C18031901]|uniref:AMP-binding protein n=1 Tax=Myxococcus dinghuensis TaxID=2906761 RepID=UPI0020A6FD55|nr:AMP-binding protein [Myxococcus dinghuensis]MCP3103203.1 AMP-binding protein [Myxococcus dinghuensis]
MSQSDDNLVGGPASEAAGDARPWVRFYPPGVTGAVEAVAEASLAEMVTSAAARFGARAAFSNLGTALSFREVDTLSTRFASFLQHLGLEKGDRIVIQMPNLLQYPVAMFGALKAGLVVVNMNPLYTVDEMKKVLADAEPRALVVLANFADKVERALEGSTVSHVVVTHVGDLLPFGKRQLVDFVTAKVKKLVPRYTLPAAIDFRRALARGGAQGFKPPALSPRDVAFLQYTGGTTGGTKAATLTHGNLLANQAQFMGLIRSVLGDGHATAIAALPLYHVFSLTVNCLGFFRFGVHNVLVTDPRDVSGFIKTLAATRPAALTVVSTLAGALLEHPEFRALDLRDLKVTVAGGMALRTSVARRWREVTGKDILEGYGLTEASPVVSVNPPHLPPRVGTIGVPLPGTEVRILDDALKPVPAGESGELAVRGPQVMQGYWKQPAETAKVITPEGWLLTGDIARVDADGYIQIVDRKKEIIVVSGFNVYPSELEDVAMRHPKVAEAGAIGVRDEKSGEAPRLFVVKRDESLTAEELLAYLREHLTGYKRPKEIVFRAALPKSNVGKVLRRALRESP